MGYIKEKYLLSKEQIDVIMDGMEIAYAGRSEEYQKISDSVNLFMFCKKNIYSSKNGDTKDE